MLNIKVFHSENLNFALYTPPSEDIFSQGDNGVVGNTAPSNFLTFDGIGLNLVDDSLKFYEFGDYVGYTFPIISNENCEIKTDDETTNSLELSYEVVSSNKQHFTLIFKDDCCRKLNLTFTTTKGTVKKEAIVSDKIFEFTLLPNSYMVRINFVKTALPHQYIRLDGIFNGTSQSITEFTNHNLLEEINVLSDDLPINQFELMFINNNVDISKIVREDPLIIYNNNKYFGTFYVIDIQRAGKTLYEIKAQNALHFFDVAELRKWKYIATLGADITEIINTMSSITNVNISYPEYAQGNYIDGLHKDGTCRQALCELGFASGQMIDSSRRDNIVFKDIPNKVSSVILTSDQRIIGDAVFKFKNSISQSYLTTKTLATIESEDEFDKRKTITGNVGDVVTVVFDNPSGINYSKSTGFDELYYSLFSSTIRLTETIAKIIYAELPIMTETTIVSNELATFINEKKYDNFNTIIYDRAANRNTNIKKFMQSKGVATAKIRLKNEKVGDLIQLETAWDGIITGIITKMNIHFGYEEIADIEVLEWSL